MPPSGIPDDPRRASRDELRRRIDEELAQIGHIEVSSWMMSMSKSTPVPVDVTTLASPLEADARLGRLLWKENAKLKEGQCFHVLTPASQLMAVIKPATGVAYLKDPMPLDDLKGWQLLRRPAAAFNAPPGYRRTTVTAVLWRFALFGTEGNRVLPPRYRHLPLSLRQLPTVERDLVPVRQVKLMQFISRSPCTFAELQILTHLSEEQLSRDLGALYLARSLRLAGPQAASA